MLVDLHTFAQAPRRNIPIKCIDAAYRISCGYINQFPASQSTNAFCIEQIALVLFFILVLFFSIITKEGYISDIVITQEEVDYKVVKYLAKSCCYVAFGCSGKWKHMLISGRTKMLERGTSTGKKATS